MEDTKSVGPRPSDSNYLRNGQEPGELKQPFKILEILTIGALVVLIIVSVASAFIYLILWYSIKFSNTITNTFSGFGGFICSNVVNLIASIAGIATIRESHTTRNKLMDPDHSNSVLCFLVAGIMYNIIFPTTVLLPVYSARIIPTVSLYECMNSHSGSYVKLCSDSGKIFISVVCMYLLVLVEGLAIILFWILKKTKRGDLFPDEVKSEGFELTRKSPSEDLAFTSPDKYMVDEAVQVQPDHNNLGERYSGGDEGRFSKRKRKVKEKESQSAEFSAAY